MSADEELEALLETAVAVGARAGIDRIVALAGSDAVTAIIESVKPSAVSWVAKHVKDLLPDRVVDVEVIAGATATGRVTFGEEDG